MDILQLSKLPERIFFINFAAVMSQRRIRLIINPISGTVGKDGIGRYVESVFGHSVEVCQTSGPGDATRLGAEAAGMGYDAVLVAGGDGTVNETAAGLCGTNVPLGIIPCGSGNGLARHLNIPVDIASSVEIARMGNIIDCDAGEVNGRPFFCTFGVGFDAAVSEKFAHQPRRGRLSYVLSVFSEYIKYNPQSYTILANGQELTRKAFLVAVCNASQYGNNAYIAPYASMTDGLLDVTIVHAGSPLTTALVGADLLTGLINRNMLIHTFRTKSLSIIREEAGAAHIDGEPEILPERMDIQCNPGRLKVFAPGAEPHFTPLITPAHNLLRDLKLTLAHMFNEI